MSLILKITGKLQEVYLSIVIKFLNMVEKIKSLNPAYKQPGDGSNGTCDCIGLIIGAVRRMGLKWTGIHGSNYAARFAVYNLEYIADLGSLNKGDIVLKAANEKGVVKLACNAGTKSHKWDLPTRYKKGNAYYTGDMNDYYHAGVVTQVSPLRITHMTSPHMKVDTNLNGGWNYHGQVKQLVELAQKELNAPVVMPLPVPKELVPNEGSKAIVVSGNKGPVKLRQYPSTSCRTWYRIPYGTEVTIIEPGEEWAKINVGKRKGWYMKAEFLDVVGDGKGKY